MEHITLADCIGLDAVIKSKLVRSKLVAERTRERQREKRTDRKRKRERERKGVKES